MRACVMSRCFSDILAAFSSKVLSRECPATLPLVVVQRSVGNSLTCSDGPLYFTRTRLTALPKPKVRV
jgi:hypothetical protein